ncbi:MAG: FAD-dependent oxidoreductase [Candidatus Omnitrophota bacterium]
MAEKKILDLIIAGAGPAGITASVYAARKKLDFMVISEDIGGQTGWSGDIENYTGYQFITGPDLVNKFEEHMRRYNVELKEGERVIEVKKTGPTVSVRTGKGTYEAKTVIIASGKKSRELGVPGEREFKNRGLTYCATCDGPLFSGKDVAVIGGGNSALDAALQLIKIAKFVHVVNIAPALTGDAVMKDKVEASPIARILNDTKVTAVTGEKFVNGIKIRRGGREETVPVEGVFVEIGLIPNSGIAPDVEKNQRGEIKVNSYNETSVPGIFAAGDVTDVPEKQIVIAAGEGSKAALGAFRYLNKSR